MKTKSSFIALVLLALSTLISQPSTALAQGTAFTYQGQLQNNGSPASGTYNLSFTLFATNTGGVSVAEPVTNNAVAVTNGLFTVLVDFGAGVFTGASNWLEIAVETNGASLFTTLSPRQQMTPTPYAIDAESAGNLSGTMSASQLTSIGNTNSNYGNFFVGPSGNPTMSGIDNTANGVGALASNTSGSYNTANGLGALLGNTSGSQNTANGVNALYYNTSGSFNTANGMFALYSNTNGYDNVANGYEALYSNTSGSQNTADGNAALSRNTSGSQNTASGDEALEFNTNGAQNTANGFQALQNNTSGSQNTADGMNALVGNTTGTFNTAEGVGALQINTNGSGNLASGYQALFFNASGSWNSANGIYALYNNMNGSQNTANGGYALFSNTNGSFNIALGYQAGYNVTAGSFNIDIGNAGLATDTNIIRIGNGQSQTFIAGVINGNGSGLNNLNVSAAQLTSIGNTNGGANNFFVGGSGNPATSGSYNTANGGGALASNTSGSYNTANGFAALGQNVNGSLNTAYGAQALYTDISSYNTAIGEGALYFNTSGSNNIALGYAAGEFINTGSSNIDIGNQGLSTDANIIRIGSGQSQTFIAGVINGNGGGLNNLNAAQLTSIGNANGGSQNFFVGPSGNSTTSGSQNTADGLSALAANTSGTQNTANGFQALQSNTTGSQNTANGMNALVGNTTGIFNTASGVGAMQSNTAGSQNMASGYQALFSNTRGSNNIAVGFQAGFNTTTGSSNIDIGNQGLSTDANIIRIGTSQTATYLAGTVYGNNVQLTSDRNAKENFKPVDSQAVLARVAALPVTEWNYKTDQAGVQHIGPMAQDFQAAFQLSADDKHISVVDEGGVALAAIQGLNQKLQEELNHQDAENAKLKQQNDLLAERLSQVEAIVKQLAAQK